MSTSSSVYNLTTKESFSLDHAWWLYAPDFRSLMTTEELEGHIQESVSENDGFDCFDDLLKLRDWARSNPNCAFVVLRDKDFDVFLDLFKDYKSVNNNVEQS